MTDSDFDKAPQPLDEDEMAALAERLESLPIEHVEWVLQLYRECKRARESEGRLLAGGSPAAPEDTTQLVLDTADWLRTLWEVGYMGGESFPAAPRSDFPQISVNDILKSALLSRIRHGKRPLPFPPPTRNGMPWHELVESDEAFAVRAEFLDEDWCSIEGCTDWQVVATFDPGYRYRVQHRGKGPIYELTLDIRGAGRLQKCPATIKRRILAQQRAGTIVYLLEWPNETGGNTFVPLRAASRDRAESEAARWVALRHPDLYGQIEFERAEA